MKYHIYHAIEMDHSIEGREKPLQRREYVGEVEARDEEHAFELSNNIDSNWHDTARSTSIGDVIYSVDEDIYYLCEAIGWSEITPDQLGCEPIHLIDKKPEYLYFEGSRYSYSDELAAQIMSTMPNTFTVGYEPTTIEQAKEKFGDDFVFLPKEDQSCKEE